MLINSGLLHTSNQPLLRLFPHSGGVCVQGGVAVRRKRVGESVALVWNYTA